MALSNVGEVAWDSAIRLLNSEFQDNTDLLKKVHDTYRITSQRKVTLEKQVE